MDKIVRLHRSTLDMPDSCWFRHEFWRSDAFIASSKVTVCSVYSSHFQIIVAMVLCVLGSSICFTIWKFPAFIKLGAYVLGPISLHKSLHQLEWYHWESPLLPSATILNHLVLLLGPSPTNYYSGLLLVYILQSFIMTNCSSHYEELLVRNSP